MRARVLLVAALSAMVSVAVSNAQTDPGTADEDIGKATDVYVQPLASILISVNNTGDYVALSLGASDGVREGDKLYVSDGPQYKGQIQIVLTLRDRALGKVISSVEKMKAGDRAWNAAWKMLPCDPHEWKASPSRRPEDGKTLPAPKR